MINKSRDSDGCNLSQASRPRWCWTRPPRVGPRAGRASVRAQQLREPRLPARHATTRTLVLKFYRAARAGPMRRSSRSTRSRWSWRPRSCRWPRRCVIGGQTLLRFSDFRFAAFPFMRGRAPELDAPEARQILGRSLARLHQVGARRPFAVRPRIGVERLGWEARAQVLASELLPRAPARALRLGERGAAGAGERRLRRRRRRAARSACTATAISGICCGTSRVRCSSTSMTARWVRACRTCG